MSPPHKNKHPDSVERGCAECGRTILCMPWNFGKRCECMACVSSKMQSAKSGEVEWGVKVQDLHAALNRIEEIKKEKDEEL